MKHLDTNVVIEWLRGNQQVRGKIMKHAGALALSTLALAELRHGVRRSSRPTENHQRLQDFLLGVEILPFDTTAADCYARIRLNLERVGQPIGEMDMLIAASAMAHDAVLVTHNLTHFNRIADLQMEDWQTDASA